MHIQEGTITKTYLYNFDPFFFFFFLKGGGGAGGGAGGGSGGGELAGGIFNIFE